MSCDIARCVKLNVVTALWLAALALVLALSPTIRPAHAADGALACAALATGDFNVSDIGKAKDFIYYHGDCIPDFADTDVFDPLAAALTICAAIQDCKQILQDLANLSKDSQEYKDKLDQLLAFIPDGDLKNQVSGLLGDAGVVQEYFDCASAVALSGAGEKLRDIVHDLQECGKSIGKVLQDIWGGIKDVAECGEYIFTLGAYGSCGGSDDSTPTLIDCTVQNLGYPYQDKGNGVYQNGTATCYCPSPMVMEGKPEYCDGGVCWPAWSACQCPGNEIEIALGVCHCPHDNMIRSTGPSTGQETCTSCGNLQVIDDHTCGCTNPTMVIRTDGGAGPHCGCPDGQGLVGSSCQVCPAAHCEIAPDGVHFGIQGGPPTANGYCGGGLLLQQCSDGLSPSIDADSGMCGCCPGLSTTLVCAKDADSKGFTNGVWTTSYSAASQGNSCAPSLQATWSPHVACSSGQSVYQSEGGACGCCPSQSFAPACSVASDGKSYQQWTVTVAYSVGDDGSCQASPPTSNASVIDLVACGEGKSAAAKGDGTCGCNNICNPRERYVSASELSRGGGKPHLLLGGGKCEGCGWGQQTDPNDPTKCANICSAGQRYTVPKPKAGKSAASSASIASPMKAAASPCEKCASGRTDPKDATKCLPLELLGGARTSRETTTERPSKPKAGSSGATAKTAPVRCGPRMRPNASGTGCVPDLDLGDMGSPGSGVHGVVPGIAPGISTRGRR